MSSPARLAGRRIALAVCGSIAAYKAIEVARLLIGEGASVTPLMTRAAAQFVGPLTFAGICGVPVIDDMFDARYPGEVHVAIGRAVDLVLIVPATADVLARLAAGRADDVVTALALCTSAPLLVAPAMHAQMWTHPATQRNVAQLQADGRIALVGPVWGPLASRESGPGRLAEPIEIVNAAVLLLAATQHSQASEETGQSAADLTDLRLVVTAGPTVEDIDPVRFLSNRSTGKMGFAVAERAAARGASVTLLAGPVALATPAGVRRVDFRSVGDLEAALGAALGPDLDQADALVMAAAVGDYLPRERHATKLKKTGGTLQIELVQGPDLLLGIGQRRHGALPILIGFAVETGDTVDLLAYASAKREQKKVDLVVANHAEDGFAKDTNRATFVSEQGAEALGSMSKRALADRLLDELAVLARSRGVLSC
jgi:phosphopantothenoylcysteine decarboxylase/phosphopantothenate--cysteine ligase